MSLFHILLISSTGSFLVSTSYILGIWTTDFQYYVIGQLICADFKPHTSSVCGCFIYFA